MNAADQKDLYEDLDVLTDALKHSSRIANDVLVRVLEALADSTPQLADLRRQAVRRWLRDQAQSTLDRGVPKGLPSTPKRMHMNELTGETWFE